MVKDEIWACPKCGVAFPEGLPYAEKKCPYCGNDLKVHKIVDPFHYKKEEVTK